QHCCLVGGRPFEMAAQEKVAGCISQRHPLVLAKLCPIVTEILKFPEPALRRLKKASIEILLGFGAGSPQGSVFS
ncbi:MAG TPA: hypothetical protein VFO91_05910, partial [Anaerolineales bacterium]|nr:hypothetical protein [Anaerolineales bacterium]